MEGLHCSDMTAGEVESGLSFVAGRSVPSDTGSAKTTAWFSSDDA
jgi:hypothetical protein